MREDNHSRIKLTVAPAISRKSRHIFVNHHFIRSLFQNKIIKPVHTNTHDMVPDMHTKVMGPGKFLYFRSKLLNLSSDTSALH